MKRFLTTTAAALVLGTTAYADGHTAVFSDMEFDSAINLNASELIGARVYASENEVDAEMTVEADGEKEWDDIGEINEIVLSRAGDVQNVIVGVGGFIGIGEKDVSISMDELKFISDGEEADEYFVVVQSSVAGIEDAPAYIGSDADEDTMMDDEAAMADDADRPMLMAPDIERDGYTRVSNEDLTTEDLTGARVYGLNDEDVGEISELILNDDGTIGRAVIDVGGFLGMGERPVAVTLEELNITRSDDGDDFRVYIDSTQEALEAQPEYEG